MSTQKAYLLLEDGTIFEGISMGKTGTAFGEVVFNTSTSYQDILSDPTYFGQIVTQTFPLIGNRGVDPDSRLHASGYIVREWCVEPTDAHEFMTLDEYLNKCEIVGLCGIDTRSLTRIIRKKGVMNGAITDSLDNKSELLEKIKEYRVASAVGKVTVSVPVKIPADGTLNLAILDYGFNQNILKHLTARGVNITLYPASSSADEVLAGNPDGILLSDGPGDPWDNPQIIAVIKELMSSGKPLFGIGLGHQLLGVASEFSCVKLPVGHRGANQPSRRLDTGTVMITSQNHGYAVSGVNTAVADITAVNVNDGTVEGLRYKTFPAFTVQFEPTDGNGYQDTAWVFDEFVSMMKNE